MIEEIKVKILDYVVENFSVDREEIFLDESLIDQGIIDSTGLIEIIAFLETEFSLKVEEEHMITENFGSIMKIASFILHQINQSSSLSSAA